MSNAERQKRITEVLLGYWNILKGSRLFPDEPDISPADISDVWDNCFVVKILDDEPPHDFVYMYFGNQLEGAYGTDLCIDDTPPLASPQVERLVTKYEEICNNKVPIIDEDAFVNAFGQTVRFRQILLPLGPDDGKVTHILGGLRFKVFEKETPAA